MVLPWFCCFDRQLTHFHHPDPAEAAVMVVVSVMGTTVVPVVVSVMVMLPSFLRSNKVVPQFVNAKLVCNSGEISIVGCISQTKLTNY